MLRTRGRRPTRSDVLIWSSKGEALVGNATPPDDVVHSTSDERSHIRNKHISNETLLRTRVFFNSSMEHHVCLPASSMLRAPITSGLCRDHFLLLTSLLLSSFRTSRPYPPPVRAFIFIASRILHSRLVVDFHRLSLAHALALSASQLYAQEKAPTSIDEHTLGGARTCEIDLGRYAVYLLLIDHIGDTMTHHDVRCSQHSLLCFSFFFHPTYFRAASY